MSNSQPDPSCQEPSLSEDEMTDQELLDFSDSTPSEGTELQSEPLSSSSEETRSSSTSGRSSDSGWQDEQDDGPADNQHNDSLRLKPVPKLTRSGSFKKEHAEIMMIVETLHDNGEFQQFDRVSEFLKNKYQRNIDIKGIIVIEQGVNRYFQSDLRGCKEYLKEALTLAEYAENSGLLKARVLYWLGHYYRQKGKLGKANDQLHCSKQLLCMHDSLEDNAEVNYGLGNVLMVRISSIVNPSPQVKEFAKRYFAKEYEIASECKELRVQEKKKRYALLRIAQLLLESKGLPERRRKLPPKDIAEAKSALDKLQTTLWENIHYGTKIEYYFTRSDQFLQEGNLSRARDLAKDAYDMIIEKNFRKHLKLAEKRVRYLENLIVPNDPVKEIPFDQFKDRKDLFTDEGGHSGDVESALEDDEITDQNPEESQDLDGTGQLSDAELDLSDSYLMTDEENSVEELIETNPPADGLVGADEEVGTQGIDESGYFADEELPDPGKKAYREMSSLKFVDDVSKGVKKKANLKCRYLDGSSAHKHGEESKNGDSVGTELHEMHETEANNYNSWELGLNVMEAGIPVKIIADPDNPTDEQCSTPRIKRSSLFKTYCVDNWRSCRPTFSFWKGFLVVLFASAGAFWIHLARKRA